MKEYLEVERLAAGEALRLLNRDGLQYTKQIAGMYVANIIFNDVTLDDARLARAAYFYARHIDDALDGEHSGYPLNQSMPDQLPVDVASLDSSAHPIAALGRYTLKGLSARERPDDNPRSDLQILIDSMVFDYERSQSRELFANEAELGSYFRGMARGTNLLLIGFSSALREDVDLPKFAHGVGRVQSLRDLRDDWNSGILNVPFDVINEPAHELGLGASDLNYRQLVSLPNFMDWQSDQLVLAKSELTESIEIAKSFGVSDSGARVVALRGVQTLGYANDMVF